MAFSAIPPCFSCASLFSVPFFLFTEEKKGTKEKTQMEMS
jgi:hypothetical protein